MQITNTLTGRKEPFEPISLPVRMYVCGLTPKDEPHLGHARLFVANDVIRRYLEYRGFPVKYVQNFTDIDDKTIAAAQREHLTPFEVARRYMDGYFQDMDALAVRRADVFTYVTEYIPQIIAFVQRLIDKGHAYALGDGEDRDVYFAADTFPDYGKLSKRGEEAMQAGARIEPDERKHDPRDFALWKSAKPGEPWWESPWGHGRPGWHIECSTMAMETLGEQIDIHGGGADLIFPHHENEIAQSESLTGVAPFARYWVHAGLLQLADEKMAHSGKFVTIRSVLRSTPAPALRLYLLAHSYRTQFVYLQDQLAAAVTRWRRWVEARQSAAQFADKAEAEAIPAVGSPFAGFREEFVEAMDDDFNTSRGVVAIDEMVKRINDLAATSAGDDDAETRAQLHDGLSILDELTGVLGVALDPALDVRRTLSDAQRAEVEVLVAARGEARKAKQWAEADRIRQELSERFGVVIKDSPQGSTWEVQ